MDTVEIKGVLYKKSSLIAEDFGYTTDYVGQLCRAKKVAAQMVGRSWYVDPKSVENYREHRYENEEESEDGVSKDQDSSPASRSSAQHELSGLSPLRHRQGFALPQYVRELSYEEDTSELVPLVKKKNAEQSVPDRNPIAINILLDKKTPQESNKVDEMQQQHLLTSVAKDHLKTYGTTKTKKQTTTLAFAENNQLTRISDSVYRSKKDKVFTKNASQTRSLDRSSDRAFFVIISLVFTVLCFCTVLVVGLYGVSVLSYQKESEFMTQHYELEMSSEKLFAVWNFIHDF
jgi:hypothetical protein